jgi:hypothetical protein
VTVRPILSNPPDQAHHGISPPLICVTGKGVRTTSCIIITPIKPADIDKQGSPDRTSEAFVELSAGPGLDRAAGPGQEGGCVREDIHGLIVPGGDGPNRCMKQPLAGRICPICLRPGAVRRGREIRSSLRAIATAFSVHSVAVAASMGDACYSGAKTS